MTTGAWTLRLGTEAERDFVDILRYTRDRFGDQQAAHYRATLLAALSALETGPDVLGSVSRDEIRSGLRSIHVARLGRRGRHFLLYREAGGDTIEVVRILHDGMDLARHIPPRTE